MPTLQNITDRDWESAMKVYLGNITWDCSDLQDNPVAVGFSYLPKDRPFSKALPRNNAGQVILPSVSVLSSSPDSIDVNGLINPLSPVTQGRLTTGPFTDENKTDLEQGFFQPDTFRWQLDLWSRYRLYLHQLKRSFWKYYRQNPTLEITKVIDGETITPVRTQIEIESQEDASEYTISENEQVLRYTLGLKAVGATFEVLDTVKTVLTVETRLIDNRSGETFETIYHTPDPE